MNNKHIFINDDCFSILKEIKDASIDLIICDPPYKITKNKWDQNFDIDALMLELRRLIKDNGKIIIFGQGLHSAKLIVKNEDIYRQTLIWEKTQPTGFLNAKKRPLSAHEDILIFYKKRGTYNPVMSKGERKVSSSAHKRNSKKTTNYGDHELYSYDSDMRYPRSVLKFSKDTQKLAIHPTQKPLALIEMLIKMYSNEGDLVLDPTAGSGTTFVACKNQKRSVIAIEKDEEYFTKAIDMIKLLKNRR